MNSPTLENLLQTCTVRLEVCGAQGTGFFVAPGLILTCAHVVENANSQLVQVHWLAKNIQLTAEIFKLIVDPNIDLALLKLGKQGGLLQHPCVYLDESVPKWNDLLFCFGYPEDNPDGDPIRCEFEGEGFRGDSTLLKLSRGQFNYGSSGSPVLNCRTNKVCGVVAISRNVSNDLGARAVPSYVVLRQFPHLSKQQQEFHQRDHRWNITALQGHNWLGKQIIGGALGAGLSLGILRAILAPLLSHPPFVYFFIFFIVALFLGAALTWGMAQGEKFRGPTQTCSWPEVFGGCLCFGLVHLLLALTLSSSLDQAPLVVPLGFVAGLVLSLALHNLRFRGLETSTNSHESRATRRVSLITFSQDLLRIIFVASSFALIQWIFIWFHNYGTGLAIALTSDDYKSNLEPHTNLVGLKDLMQKYPKWFDMLSILDSVFVGIAFFIGIKAGWQAVVWMLARKRT